jgi:hypothetical protein
MKMTILLPCFKKKLDFLCLKITQHLPSVLVFLPKIEKNGFKKMKYFLPGIEILWFYNTLFLENFFAKLPLTVSWPSYHL